MTVNKVLYSLHKPDAYLFVTFKFLMKGVYRMHNVRRTFQREQDFGETSGKYNCEAFFARAERPG